MIDLAVVRAQIVEYEEMDQIDNVSGATELMYDLLAEVERLRAEVETWEKMMLLYVNMHHPSREWLALVGDKPNPQT